MRKKLHTPLLTFGLLTLIFSSCGDPEAVKAKEEKIQAEKIEAKRDSIVKENIGIHVELKKRTELTDAPGIIGVYEVGEMLTLCRKDSASADKMAEAFAKNYALLEADLKLLGIKSEGAPGSIYYNNDQNNLVFECVYPIMDSAMPKRKPKNSNIVALEAAPMVVYNHYGPYSELYTAYANIKAYLINNLLVQAGPMREFYLNDPTKVKDPAQWLTRIMVPVMKRKAGEKK
jgi:effector-binding domain-containing protein